MITPEQAEQIKQHLLGQLNNFPEDQRNFVKEKILSMTNVELEAFVKQNQLTHLEKENPSESSCIFCSIVQGKIPSYKLTENKDNIVILEINPLSRGHALVVPKEHLDVSKIPSSAFTLAKKIAKKIETKLKPQEVKISSQNLFGHAVLEILPIYGNESERHKATQEELIELKVLLEIKGKKPRPKKEKFVEEKTSASENIPILKPRIP
ncbi:HIT domain-containing protein [archaeon]|nr:HIT domain-containing protein [archaeon]